MALTQPAKPVKPGMLFVQQTRWTNVLPEKYRDQFLERLKDPSIYSLRSEIALNDLYISRLLKELGLAPPEPGVEGPHLTPDGDQRLTYNEQAAWGHVMEALKLRKDLVAQEVKTLELLAQHGGRQAERAQALIAIVTEVLRRKMATTPEGRAQLVEIADELESEIRRLQSEEAA